jgi:hypothetical protein
MHERTDELTNAEGGCREGEKVDSRNARTRVHGRIYMVEWEHHGIVKIGVTTGRRWETFVGRGGVLRHLEAPSPDALDKEQRLHAAVRSVGWPQAFTCKEAAVPFLGHEGAGWTECYRLGEPGSHRAQLVRIDELAEARRRRGA